MRNSYRKNRSPAQSKQAVRSKTHSHASTTYHEHLRKEAKRVERRVRAALDLKSRMNFHLAFLQGSAFGEVTAGMNARDVLELNGRTRDGETVYVCVTWGGFGLNFALVQPWEVFKRRLTHKKPKRGHEEDYCPYEISSWNQLISIIHKVCRLKRKQGRDTA